MRALSIKSQAAFRRCLFRPCAARSTAAGSCPPPVAPSQDPSHPWHPASRSPCLSPSPRRPLCARRRLLRTAPGAKSSLRLQAVTFGFTKARSTSTVRNSQRISSILCLSAPASGRELKYRARLLSCSFLTAPLLKQSLRSFAIECSRTCAHWMGLNLSDRQFDLLPASARAAFRTRNFWICEGPQYYFRT